MHHIITLEKLKFLAEFARHININENINTRKYLSYEDIDGKLVNEYCQFKQYLKLITAQETEMPLLV